jgi:hypothetical protein
VTLTEDDFYEEQHNEQSMADVIKRLDGESTAMAGGGIDTGHIREKQSCVPGILIS